MARKKEEKDNSVLSREDINALRAKDQDEKLKLFRELMDKSKIPIDYRQMSDQSTEEVEVISTGVLSVDRALKVFGFPRGRIIELYGEEGSGKTALSLLAAGNVLRNGGVVVLFDMECAYDKKFGELLGVSDKLIVVTPSCAEDAFQQIIYMIDLGYVDLIIVDSVANMVPKKELYGKMTDQDMGLLARIMSKGLRKVTNAIAKTNTCLIFINQIRMKIGVMFGDPRTRTGGKALPFYASVIVEVKGGSTSKIKVGDKIIGHKSHVTVQKNKVGPPFGEGNVTLIYTDGIDVYQDTFDVAKEEGIIEGTTWLSYQSDIYTENNGLIKMQGADKFVDFLKNNGYIACEIRDKVIKKIEAERLEYQKKRNLKAEEQNEKTETEAEVELTNDEEIN